MTPELPAERLREFLHYDPETGVFVWLVRSAYHVHIGDVAGNTSSAGYREITIRYRNYKAHRLAWLYVHGEWPNVIDHINGDKTDNRIANLRNVDRFINQQNQRQAQKKNNSGFLGVCATRGRYHAHLCVKGRQRFVGSFATAQEAHEAYLLAKRELHEGCTI